MRRLTMTIALVALVALAGCMGGTSPENTATETPTATPEPVTYPNGFNETGVTNATIASDGHQSSAVESGSWHVVYDAQFDSKDRTMNVTRERTVAVSGDKPREFVTIDSNFGKQELYTNQTSTYKKAQMGNKTNYMYSKKGIDLKKSSYSGMFGVFFKSVKYEKESHTVEDGKSVITYTGTELTENNRFEKGPSNRTVENIESKIVVDETGKVHEFTFSGDVVKSGNTNHVDFTVTFTKYGTATVSEPGWIDDAKSQTGPSSLPENETSN